ncbi:MAG: DNA adenine methylase [Candidatus Accumulibacter sp.]|jgi:DNA adenine methylase|nr:DNA adenine methylase [Accumulibacter sp.]
MEISKEVTRSALRYFGGKWALAPWIIEHMPPHRVYVEPFGGGASVLLRKPRSKIEVYNDADQEIVGLFRVLQDPKLCRELFRRLRRTLYARSEFNLAFKATDDPVVRAQRAIIRAYMSFHHSALFNPGKNTFANARHRKGGYCKAGEWSTYPRHLASICRRLRGVVIDCCDARDVIRVQDTHDALFFVDPPYVPSTRKSGGYRHEMTEAGHVELLTQLRAIQGRAMISGYASALYDDMLHDWTRLTHKHYAAAGEGAQLRSEVLWISPPQA